MQRELVSLLNEHHQHRGRRGRRGRGEQEEEVEGLSSGHFQMPYDIVRDGGYCTCCHCWIRVCVLGIEQTFRDHLQKLREQLETITQQPSVGDEERGQEEEGEGTDVAALQIKLSDYRDIIGRQEEMLKVCTHTHAHARHSPYCQ